MQWQTSIALKVSFYESFLTWTIVSDELKGNDLMVLKYGSDPLKTYLPDSDIDVTLIVNNNFQSLKQDG